MKTLFVRKMLVESWESNKFPFPQQDDKCITRLLLQSAHLLISALSVCLLSPVSDKISSPSQLSVPLLYLRSIVDISSLLLYSRSSYLWLSIPTGTVWRRLQVTFNSLHSSGIHDPWSPGQQSSHQEYGTGLVCRLYTTPGGIEDKKHSAVVERLIWIIGKVSPVKTFWILFAVWTKLKYPRDETIDVQRREKGTVREYILSNIFNRSLW